MNKNTTERTLILACVGMMLGISGTLVSLFVIKKEGHLTLAAFFTAILIVSIFATEFGAATKKIQARRKVVGSRSL